MPPEVPPEVEAEPPTETQYMRGPIGGMTEAAVPPQAQVMLAGTGGNPVTMISQANSIMK